MKRLSSNWITAVLFAGVTSVCVYVYAQVAPEKITGTLTDAISLYEEGQYEEARLIIASIEKTDSSYQSAQCYKALCLHALDELKEFWKTVEPLDLTAVPVKAEIREDLAYKRIAVLFYFRKFEGILPRIDEFESAYSTSTQLTAVAEMRTATLFDRGMKKVKEGNLFWGEQSGQERWAEGTANLQEFLSLVSDTQMSSYSALPKRDLREDVWTARLALGEESALQTELSGAPEETREEFSLLRLQLYEQLQPERLDRNLQFMAEFLSQFPNSKYRNKVEFDLASRKFERGKELCIQADEAEFGGEASVAAEKRAAAAQCFSTQRALQGSISEEAEVGIAPSDLYDLKKDVLHSYFYQRDYANVRAQAVQMIADSVPGELQWKMAKLFDGIALMSMTPPRSAEATSNFDEILEYGFMNRPDQDQLAEVAARWRVQIAMDSGDEQKARQVVESVRDSECTKNIKSDFLVRYSEFLTTEVNGSN